MGAVITLFLIGLTLSLIHFVLGIALEFIRMREGTAFPRKIWLCYMSLSAVVTFLLFAYGVGSQLCLGRSDYSSCVGAVVEVAVKMGIVIFPLIILLGMLGVFLGSKLAQRFRIKHTSKTKKKVKTKTR